MADILKLRMDKQAIPTDADNSTTTLTHFRHPIDEQLGQVDMF